jgi:branched-chain amino acid transport system substrate-binding protein
MGGTRRREATMWLAASGLPVTVWAAPPPPNPGVSPREIIVGHTITLQEGKNAQGVATQEGVQLYIDAINARGGVLGRKLVLRVLDDQNKPAQAETNAQQLIDEGAFLLFGCIEGAPSTAVAKVATAAGVPLFGPMAGPPTLRRPHQSMVFPVRAEHREEFRALLKHGASQGLRTVGFFHADSEGGRAHLENVRLIAAGLNMQVTHTLPFKNDISDQQLDAMVEGLAKDAPSMLFNHGSPSNYQKLISKSKAAGLRCSFMAVNSGSSQIVDSLGELARGMVFTQIMPSPSERKHAISREYQAAMRAVGKPNALSYGGLEGYATAKALVMALRAAGRDLTRAKLLATLGNADFDLGGVKLKYRDGDHEGSRFVDLSLVNREGKFIH